MDTAKFPQYDVNGKKFGGDYATANMYWMVNGGTLGERLDQMTPWHALQTKAEVK